MSDIKDILGISRDASAGASRPRAPKPSVKKPEGMSREVFALLHQDGGGSTVPLSRFRRCNLKRNGVKAIRIAFRLALQHCKYLFRIRHCIFKASDSKLLSHIRDNAWLTR